MARSSGSTERGGRRRERRSIPQGIAHVQSTYNNTIVTITDPEGNVVAWASGGTAGFKGNKKGTPFAAQLAAQNAGRKAQGLGMRRLDSIMVRGPGSGRETAIRALQGLGFQCGPIKDATPFPHNGCRPKKRRRV